jgi:hypothetical protein
MSTDEKDSIIGRLVRERKSATEDVAALESKALRMADQLSSFSSGVASRCQGRHVAGSSMDDIMLGATNAPLPMDLLAVMQELEAERRGLASLIERLAAFGI